MEKGGRRSFSGITPQAQLFIKPRHEFLSDSIPFACSSHTLVTQIFFQINNASLRWSFHSSDSLVVPYQTSSSSFFFHPLSLCGHTISLYYYYFIHYFTNTNQLILLFLILLLLLTTIIVLRWSISTALILNLSVSFHTSFIFIYQR